MEVLHEYLKKKMVVRQPAELGQAMRGDASEFSRQATFRKAKCPKPIQSNNGNAEGFDEKKYAFNLAQTTQEQKLFFLQCISEGRQKIQNSDIFRDAFLSCEMPVLKQLKTKKQSRRKLC